MANFLQLGQNALQSLRTTIVNERISTTVIETWRIGRTCDVDRPKLYIPSQLLECFVKLPRGWWRGPENNKCFDKGFLKFVWLWCEKTQGRQDSWLEDPWYQIGLCFLLAVWSLASSIPWLGLSSITHIETTSWETDDSVSKSRLTAWQTWYINIINIIILEGTEWMGDRSRLDRVDQPGWWRVRPAHKVPSPTGQPVSCSNAHQLHFQILVLSLTNFNWHLIFVRQHARGL